MIAKFQDILDQLKIEISQIPKTSHSSTDESCFNEIDKKYKAVTFKLVNMIEDLNLLLQDIEYRADKNRQDYFSASFDRGPIENTIKELSKFLYFEMPYILNECLIKKNTSIFPNNYRFEYSETFGENIIKQAGKILVSKSERMVFVSDSIANVIHKFDLNGTYLGQISPDLNYPFGLFPDSQNKLWICDFYNNRLLCVTHEGNMVEEINLIRLLNGNCDYTFPLFGAVQGNIIYIRSAAKPFKKAVLIAINTNDYSYRIIDSCTFQHIEDDIKIYGDEIFTQDYRSASLYRYNPNKNEFTKLFQLPLKDGFRHFEKQNDCFMICVGNNILKMNNKGDLLFAVDVNKALKTSRFMANDISLFGYEGKDILFISDDRQKCIHKFFI